MKAAMLSAMLIGLLEALDALEAAVEAAATDGKEVNSGRAREATSGSDSDASLLSNCIFAMVAGAERGAARAGGAELSDASEKSSSLSSDASGITSLSFSSNSSSLDSAGDGSLLLPSSMASSASLPSVA